MHVGLFDFSGHFHPVWHASGDREVGHARQHTLARARALAADYDVFVVCCEGKGSWRKERDSRYKANRPPTSEVMLEEMRRTEQALADDGYPVVRADGMEADDIIATLANYAAAEGDNVWILSNDKDFAQCVSERVVLSTDKGEYDE